MPSRKFIEQVAREAGKKALSMFGKTGPDRFKSDSRLDVVTKADIASEKIIIGRIKKKFPTHGIISEESGSSGVDAEYVWTIDPIDGTFNYSTGVPLWSVMIALMHRNEIIMSVIYIPTTDELFFAQKGRGAYLNGKRIHCSKVADWDGSVGGGVSHIGKPNSFKFLRRFIKEIGGRNAIVQHPGGIGVTSGYVACGRRDWFVGFHAHDWDYVPAALLLQESGCKVTAPSGKKWKLGDVGLIAANPKLYSKLMGIVTRAKVS